MTDAISTVNPVYRACCLHPAVSYVDVWRKEGKDVVYLTKKSDYATKYELHNFMYYFLQTDHLQEQTHS